MNVARCLMSDSVTVDYRNEELWHGPGSGLWFPRWIRVRVLKPKGTGYLVSTVDWHSEPFEIETQHCPCGTEFGFKSRFKSAPLCRMCDAWRLAEQQRRRRWIQRTSMMRSHCQHCGSVLTNTKRTTRIYCSGRCRTAALREKKTTPFSAAGESAVNCRGRW